MFDLFRSRAKAVRIMLGAMLGLVALSMLVYLIPGAGTPTGDRNDDVVAEIGKEKLTVSEIEQQIRSVLQNRQLPPEMVQVYIPQLVDQAIADRAMAYQAQQLGFKISDENLANTIRSLPFGSLPPDQYRAQIEQQFNMTVAGFEHNLRLKNYEDAIQMVAFEGIVVTPAEVEATYKRRNEKIKLDYIGFDPGKLAAEVKPTPQELKTYFDTNKGAFLSPESRSIELLVADPAKIGESIQVSDAQVQSYYSSHMDQYRTPERVHARHILLSTAGKQENEKPKIKAAAEDLLKQLKGGGDFAKLAEKNSADPGSAQKGGDLGWVVRGQMVKEFEETTFSLKPKEISNVITTQYGYHIIQVLEKEPARLRSLAEAKPEILTAVRGQSVFDRMQTVADQAHAELVKAPQNAPQIAVRFNLILAKADKFKPGDALPELGPDPQIGGTIASMKASEVSQVVQTANKLATVIVTAVNPSHPADFSEVEAQVRQRYQGEKSGQVVTDKAKKAADVLKANGGDVKAAAKAVGLESKATDFFSRDGSADGISATYLGDLFDKPAGFIIGPLNVGGQTIVAKILERQPADMNKLAQEREAIVTQAKTQRAGQRQMLLQDSVLNYLIQKGKVKKHQDTINRMMARYRG